MTADEKEFTGRGALALKSFLSPLQTSPNGLTLKALNFFSKSSHCVCLRVHVPAHHKAVGGGAQVSAAPSYFWPTSRREMERKGERKLAVDSKRVGGGDPEEGKRLLSSESASPATSSAPACVGGMERYSPVEKHEPTRTPYYSSASFIAHSFWTLPPHWIGLKTFGLQ